jgi:hypothetical protein
LASARGARRKVWTNRPFGSDVSKRIAGTSSPLYPNLERIRGAEEGGAKVEAVFGGGAEVGVEAVAGLSAQLIFPNVDDDEDDAEGEELCWAKLSGCRDERRGPGTTTEPSAIWFEFGVAGDGEEEEVGADTDTDVDCMGDVEMSAGAAGCWACKVSIAPIAVAIGAGGLRTFERSKLTGGGGGVQGCRRQSALRLYSLVAN